jgi:hypothetical protein
MITFNRIIEVVERERGNWHVRILLNKDGREHESCFLKVQKQEYPTFEDVSGAIDNLLQIKNSPPFVPEDVLGQIEELPVVLVQLGFWQRLKNWLRSWVGKR